MENTKEIRRKLSKKRRKMKVHREKVHPCNLGVESKGKVNTLVSSRGRLDSFVLSY